MTILGSFQSFSINFILPQGHLVTVQGSRERKIHRVISITSDMQMTPIMAESEEELKSLLMKVKEESGKSWLKAQHSENEDHGIWSHHFMGNRWGHNENSVRLYFLGLQNHCRW